MITQNLKSLLIILILLLNSQLFSQNSNEYVAFGNQCLSNEDFKNAILHYDSALAIDGTNYLAYYGKGCAYEKNNKYDTALYYLYKTISYRKDFSNAHLLTGTIYYKMNLYSKSIHSFEMVTKYDRNNLEAIYLRALSKDKIGNYESASIDFNILSEKVPNSKQFPLLSAIELIKYDSLYSATCRIRELLDKYPDYDTAYFYCGVAFHKNKLFDSAIDYYTKTLQINPNYFEAMNFRGRAIQARDSTVEINEDLTLWKTIKSDAVTYYLEKGYDCFYNDDIRNAKIHFATVLSFDSSNCEAYINLANSSLKLYQNVQALRFADSAIALKPINPDAELIKIKAHLQSYIFKSQTYYKKLVHYSYGSYYERFTMYRRDHVDSIKQISNKLLEMNPLSYETYTILGDLYREEKDYGRSFKYYNKALEIIEEPEIYFERSILNLRDKEYEDALSDLEKAMELDPDNLYYKVFRATYLLVLDREKESTDIFNSLLESEVNASLVYYHRGRLRYNILNSFRPACDDLDKAIELDPYYASAYLYRSYVKNVLGDDEGSFVDFNLYRKYSGFLDK